MSRLSHALIMLVAAALIAGCGSAPTRYGKGNDHEVVHPEEDQAEEDQAEDEER
jgi:hypothetical protein